MSEPSRLTPVERGRLGGRATVRRYGRQHMQVIGRKGGQATVETYGRERMSAIGKAGFASFCERYFAGDRAAASKWLTRRGLAAQDPFPANGVWQQATPLPAPQQVRCPACDAWVPTTAWSCPVCESVLLFAPEHAGP